MYVNGPGRYEKKNRRKPFNMQAKFVASLCQDIVSRGQERYCQNFRCKLLSRQRWESGLVFTMIHIMEGRKERGKENH